MSRGLPSFSKRARKIALAFTFAGGVLAQESATTSGSSAQSSPTIAGAKKQFESIKSARESALVPERGMPRVALPALPAAQSSGTPVTSAKKTDADPAKATTGNWLVDAMEKQDDRSDPRRDTPNLRDRGNKLRSEAGSARATDSDTREVAQGGQGTNEREAPIVVNPLARYLDDWMTPQDYALLKPGLTSPLEPRGGGKTATAINLGAAGVSGGLSEFALGGVAAPAPVLEGPKENPYLQSLKPETKISAAPMVSKPAFAPAVQMPVGQPIQPPAVSPSSPPARIPDFAKPAMDEKYFKQLKRF